VFHVHWNGVGRLEQGIALFRLFHARSIGCSIWNAIRRQTR